MPLTMDQLRRKLSDIEPDESMYKGITAGDIAMLSLLLNDPEPWLAARAVLALARLANSEVSKRLQDLVFDSRPEIRTALAVTAPLLRPKVSTSVISGLLDDSNVGVRKMAILAVRPEHGKDILGQLDRLRESERVPALRVHIEEKLKALRRPPRKKPPKKK